jgi:hypothetical protein
VRSALLTLCACLPLLVASGARAHDSTKGNSRFAVQADGRVSVQIDLQEQDVADLVDIDLSSPKEAEEAAKGLLDGRLSTALPRWLVLEGDGAPCPVVYDRWERYGTRGVRLLAEARCPARPLLLTVHWGLSTATKLNVISLAVIVTPEGQERAVTFSRARRKLELRVTPPTFFETFSELFVSGLEHIALGWDHLCFLLAVILAVPRLRRLLLVVTSFTVAHSVTLGLGALDVVRVSPQIVEPVIAASIAIAAGAALMRGLAGKLAHPGSDMAPGPALFELSLVGAFGLVHGLGFASMLRGVLSEDASVTAALLAFNVGVETGQIVIVAAVFPLLVFVGRKSWGPRLFSVLLAGLVGVGAYVAVARLLAG